jgi:hypothetical protein
MYLPQTMPTLLASTCVSPLRSCEDPGSSYNGSCGESGSDFSHQFPLDEGGKGYSGSPPGPRLVEFDWSFELIQILCTCLLALQARSSPFTDWLTCDREARMPCPTIP